MYNSPGNGNLSKIYISDYNEIDQYAKTGSLWSWGLNSSGQLGNNSTTENGSPVQTASAGTNWREVVCGSAHTAAIKTDGTLWLWGDNAYGQMGDNTTTNRSSPIQTVSGGTNWKQVAAGGAHTAAIKTDGTLWLWGLNTRGQLGDGTITSKSSPVQTTSSGNNWKQVACGQVHTTAIKVDGTLWSWGANSFGQLGTNSASQTSTPVQTTSGGTTWKLVSAGYYHTAAIKTDGTLWSWGNNTSGQLGDNTVTIKSSPVQTISAGTNWRLLECGNNHTAAIKTDGTLWLWGKNSSGQLGDGTTIAKSSPVQITSGGTNWKQVYCGSDHCAATKTDGTLWLWGDNTNGQLGDTTITARSSPVQVYNNGTNWKQVSAGGNTTSAIHFYDAGNLYPNR